MTRTTSGYWLYASANAHEPGPKGESSDHATRAFARVHCCHKRQGIDRGFRPASRPCRSPANRFPSSGFGIACASIGSGAFLSTSTAAWLVRATMARSGPSSIGRAKIGESADGRFGHRDVAHEVERSEPPTSIPAGVATTGCPLRSSRAKCPEALAAAARSVADEHRRAIAPDRGRGPKRASVRHTGGRPSPAHSDRWLSSRRGRSSPIAFGIAVERGFSSSERWTSTTGSRRASPACVLVSICSWRCGQPGALGSFGAYWPISSRLATTLAVCRMGSTCGSASLSRVVCPRTESSCRCSPLRLDRIHRVGGVAPTAGHSSDPACRMTADLLPVIPARFARALPSRLVPRVARLRPRLAHSPGVRP